jgi:hypothetical protein
MGQKYFGPAVSGYLNPDGRSFETTVFEAGKPVLDRELNLSQDLDSGFALGVARGLAASGWLTDSHVNSSEPVSSLLVTSSTANTLELANGIQALVNGWNINVSYTNSGVSNILPVGAGPAGNGAKRTDLVILEVWRTLVGPSSGTGKSAGSRFWRNGNVKIDPLDDAALNYDDDSLDPILGTETTRRVQIQYRLRVVQDVDLFSYPMGIDDPSVVANSVPADAAHPEGVATAFVYISQSANGDPGLWLAGNGIPTNTLGTVDGYMYAIPLVALFRRNTTAFDRDLNQNGGVSFAGPSDRPDGLFCDLIDIRDVADLRRATSLKGWNYQEVAERNLGFLLDNTLKTEWTTTPIGGGTDGHTVLWADEVGNADMPGATLIGTPDCTRRFFSDRPIYEVMTVKLDPATDFTWYAPGPNTTITLNPAAISQWPFPGTIGWLANAPSGTRIIDVLRARVQGTIAPLMALDVGEPCNGDPTIIPCHVVNTQGLGDFPPAIVQLELLPPGGLTIECLYVDLLVAYPPGQGLAKTPTADYTAASFSVNNPLAWLDPLLDYDSMQNQAFDYAHRELQLQYLTTNQTFTCSTETTAAQMVYYLPERAQALVSVIVDGAGPPVAATLDTSGRVVTLGASPGPGHILTFAYTAVRPIPQTPSVLQFTIYYEARAPQTIHNSLLGTSQTLVPRWISPYLYVITAGPASQGVGYPYPYAYVQTGGVIKHQPTGGPDHGGFGGEYELDGSTEVYVSDFNANTGFLKVPVALPYVPNPESVTLTRSLGDADIEGRSFFPSFAAGYVPNAYGPSLSDSRVHKVLLPVLMETVDDLLAPKGTLLLVNFLRWAAFDSENSIKYLGPPDNTTIASVFRVAGNLINRRS